MAGKVNLPEVAYIPWTPELISESGVPYCYLFLLSIFILWFSYYVSDIFCKL